MRTREKEILDISLVILYLSIISKNTFLFIYVVYLKYFRNKLIIIIIIVTFHFWLTFS